MSENLNKMCDYWREEAKRSQKAEEYYRKQLAKAHEILGRVVHQLSERWDNVNLTEFFPTDNLHHLRTINNPDGNKEKTNVP